MNYKTTTLSDELTQELPLLKVEVEGKKVNYRTSAVSNGELYLINTSTKEFEDVIKINNLSSRFKTGNVNEYLEVLRNAVITQEVDSYHKV